MSIVTEQLSATDLQSIGNLQLLARRVVEGFCSGLHRSPHKGVSVEFKQHRQYVHGDEIRHLDWKVFGKTDRFYIREYEQETNLRATLLLDCSGSMNYGEAGRINKHKFAVQLAACLAYLLLRQQDSVGLVTFDDQLRTHIPSRSRANHLRVLIDEMGKATPGGESELGEIFQEITPKLNRRGLLIVISDCFCDVERLMKALAHFRHARHDVIIFQVLDRDVEPLHPFELLAQALFRGIDHDFGPGSEDELLNLYEAVERALRYLGGVHLADSPLVMEQHPVDVGFLCHRSAGC